MANKCPAGFQVRLALVRVAAAGAATSAEHVAEVCFGWLQGRQVGIHSEIPNRIDRIKVLENAVEVASVPKVSKPNGQIKVHRFTGSLWDKTASLVVAGRGKLGLTARAKLRQDTLKSGTVGVV